MSQSEFDKQQERVIDLRNQLYAIVKNVNSIVKFIEEESLDKSNSPRKFKIKVNKNCNELITWYSSDIYNLTSDPITKIANSSFLNGCLLIFNWSQSEARKAIANSENAKTKLEYFSILCDSYTQLHSFIKDGMDLKNSIHGITDDLLKMTILLPNKSKIDQNKLIQQLVNDLIKYEYVDDSDYQQLYNLFSGDVICYKINWINDINSLGFFIYELNKANLFDEKVSQRIWQHVINCFIVNNKPLINTNNIKSNHNPKSIKVQSNLNSIISKLL